MNIVEIYFPVQLQNINMSRGVQFNEDQINEFHEAFLLYDNRGDGKISVNLIGDVMRALGQNPTESEVNKIILSEIWFQDNRSFNPRKLKNALT